METDEIVIKNAKTHFALRLIKTKNEEADELQTERIKNWEIFSAPLGLGAHYFNSRVPEKIYY